MYIERHCLHLLCQASHKLNNKRILVEDTEIETVKQTHWVLLNVGLVLLENQDDVVIEGGALVGVFLTNQIGSLETVRYLVVEVHFFSELAEVLFLYPLLDSTLDSCLELLDLNLSFKLVNLSISIKVIVVGEPWRELLDTS